MNTLPQATIPHLWKGTSFHLEFICACDHIRPTCRMIPYRLRYRLLLVRLTVAGAGS